MIWNKKRSGALMGLATLVLGLGGLGSSALAARQIAEIREPQGDFPASEYVKVAVIQFSPPTDAPIDVPQDIVDRYKAANAEALEAQIRTAASNGAKLVVTPEFATVGYPDIPNLPPEEDEFRNRADIKPFVETTDGKTSKRFAKLAKELKIYLVTGIAEVEASTDKYFNTLLVFNPKGQLIQTYRKINLFEGELKFLSAGTERKYFETEFGKVGLFTCYDIHFDNPARDLVRLDKVKAISFSTSWVGDNGITTFQSFAKSNGVYFMASNHTYFPDSGVIAPDGVIQSHIRQSSGPAYGYIKIK